MISDGIIVMDEYLQPRILAALLQATNIQYDYQINKIYSTNITAGFTQWFNTIRKPNKAVNSSDKGDLRLPCPEL